MIQINHAPLLNCTLNVTDYADVSRDKELVAATMRTAHQPWTIDAVGSSSVPVDNRSVLIAVAADPRPSEERATEPQICRLAQCARQYAA